MTAKEFAAYWQQHYAKSPPVGYLLRQAYKERWFRIHCLPESKRYPENEIEYEEILRRHNAILADILGRNGEFVLITIGYSDTPEPTPPYRKYRSAIGHHERLMSLPMHNDDPEGSPGYWHFYMSRREWKAHSLDDLLRLVADDAIGNVQLVGVKQSCLYHPYDGGADIILESQSARDFKKKQYAAWLPKNPQGL